MVLLCFDSLIIVAFAICEGSKFGVCFVMQYFSVISSFKIILIRKRELVALFFIVFLMACGQVWCLVCIES